MSKASSNDTDMLDEPGKALRDTFLRTLLLDVTEAVNRCEADGSESAYREAVRAIFAAIEGTIWEYRKHVRRIAEMLDETISPTTLLALAEMSYSVGPAGAVIDQPKYIALPAMFRLATNIAQQCSPGLTVDFGAKGWSDLQRALKIRHRITHPKTLDDLVVGSSDLACAKSGFEWLLGEVVEGMTANSASVTRYLADLREVIADLDAGDERTWEMYRQVRAPGHDPDSG